MPGCSSGRWIQPALQNVPLISTKDQPSSIPPETGRQESGAKERSSEEVAPGDLISLKAPSRKSEGASVSEEQLEKESDQLSEEEKDSEKKNYPVTYRASRLIREYKSFRQERVKKQVLTLSGKARIVHGDSTLISGKIVLIGKDGDMAVSESPLEIRDQKQNIQIKAGYGKYFRFLQRAVLKKNPVVIHTDPESGLKGYLYAREMVRDFKTGETKALGDVKILREKTRGYGDQATWYDQEKKAVLEGNPVVYDDENIFEADVITYYHGENKIVLEGNVQVILTEKKSAPGRGQSDVQVAAVVMGDYAEYRYGEKVKMGREVKVTAEKGRVLVLREDSETYCKSLLGRGDGLRELDLAGDVELFDLKDRTRVFGQLGHYWKKENLFQMLTVQEGSLQKKPYVIFHNKEDVPTGRLVAMMLERNLNEKKTYARGDVRVDLYKRQSDLQAKPEVQAVMYGQWAEVSDEERVIMLQGDPFVEYKPDRIYAGKILIYPDDNRMELTGGLHGNFSK